MKKAFLAVAVSIVLCAAGFTGYKVYDNYRISKLGPLMLENLEILSANEFIFGGETWTDEGQWYNWLGSNWKPELVNCMAPLYSAWGFYFDEVPGERVECKNGSGNCGNGTPCYPLYPYIN